MDVYYIYHTRGSGTAIDSVHARHPVALRTLHRRQEECGLRDDEMWVLVAKEQHPMIAVDWSVE